MAKSDNELRIRNVSPQVLKDLDNIAANMGVPQSSFLKMKLREIVDSAPAHHKLPQKKN